MLVNRAACLVYRVGALGDTLLMEPALAALSRTFPDLAIEWLGEPRFAGLLAHRWSASRDGTSADYAPLFDQDPLPPALAAWLAGFSRAWIVSNSDALRGHVAARIRETLALAPLPPPGDRRAVVDYLVDGLEPWGVRLPAEQRIPRVPERWRPAAASAEAMLAPGAGSPAKRWPIARWGALAAELRVRLDCRGLVILFGPAEQPLAHEFQHLAAACGAELLDTPPLDRLAVRIARARLFVGNDSGPTHLAAAIGCPTVAIFGSASDPRWRTRGPRVSIAGGCAAIEAIEVEEVVRAALESFTGSASAIASGR